MSSDPIEVLRRMRDPEGRVCIRGSDADREAIQSALASLSAPKPEGEWVLVRRSDLQAWAQDWQRENDPGDDTDVVTPFDGYLLSAPKPPPMNDNAVVVNESAPVNDKPGSAEAVAWCPACEGAGWSSDVMENFAPVTCPDCAGSGRAEHSITANESAPPRPEASAPVGVGAVVKAMRMLAGVGIPVKPECVGRWADQLEALAQQPAACDMGELCIGCEPRNADGSCPAQQPAAVDGAMVERVTNAVVGWATLPGDLPAEPEKVAELREVISTAIAGQQQGGTPE